MSEAKFTPGPWWACIGPDQPVPYYRGLVAMLGAYRDQFISIVTGKNGSQAGHECSSEEWRANAHLIAAAPDLYEALYLCMQTLDQYADVSSINEDCPNAAMTAMMRAKEVLAKARGENT